MLTSALLRSPTANDQSDSPLEVGRIAIFQALNLGDLLCATPAARALRRRFPDAEIVWLGRPAMRPLIQRLSAVDRFLPFPGFPDIAESPRVASPHGTWPPFGLALQLQGSGEISNGFVASLGATRSVGYGPVGDDRLSTVLPWVEDEPEPLRWLRLVAVVGAHSNDWSLELPMSAAERRRAASLLRPLPAAPNIGLHVGASAPARRWPAPSFAALGDRLAERYGANIVLTGSRDDRSLTSDVRVRMHHPALDLAGATSLSEFGAVVARLDLLVSNDTGASHVAAATGTPSVVLFGPTRPARWAPLDRARHRVIDARCAVPIATDGAVALRRLPVEVVLATCETVLGQRSVIDRRSRDGVHSWAG